MNSHNKLSHFFLNQPKIIASLFVVFYSVGVIGMLLPVTSHYFLQLIPFALLLSFFVLAFSDESKDKRNLILYLLFIYVSSFAIEVAGVYSGVLFGKYSYGNNLGVKLWETPLIIGANWFFLVYTTAAIFEKTRMSSALKVMLASSSMLVYDVVMEQVAPKLDMWDWKHPSVPFQNYFTWFLIAIAFHIGLQWLKIRIKNKLALTVLLCQFIFFVLLYIFLD
ncbi:MAG: carotenoid biosynthesis protein [Candidatus Saccharimonadaceae bacterium]